MTTCIGTLLSNKSSVDEKLTAAKSILASLSPPDDVPAPSPLPALIKTHYAGTLFDWCLSSIVKGKGKPGQQLDLRFQPIIWTASSSVISANFIASSHPLPSSLVPAITTLLKEISSTTNSNNNSELLENVASFIHALSSKRFTTFTPSNEHIVSLVEVAFKGYTEAKDSQKAWEQVSNAVVELLVPLGQATNQRKVWDVAVARLLIPLAQCAFSDDDSTIENAHGSSSHLVVKCQAALDMLLFHESHVKALVEATESYVPPFMLPKQTNGQGKSSSSKPYASQFFTILQIALLQSDADITTATSSSSSSRSGSRQSVLNSLPWLNEKFAQALHRYRQNVLLQGSVIRQLQQDISAKKSGSTAKDEEGVGNISDSADFLFYAALLKMPLDVLPTAKHDPAKLLRCCGDLTETLKRGRIYRVNEDSHGKHRQLLYDLANAAVHHRQTSTDVLHGIESGDIEQASLYVVRAILAVEHRAIQQHLPIIWPLIWRSSSSKTNKKTSTGNKRSDTNLALDVACSLIVAFSELRQMDVFLTSLADGLEPGAVGVVSSHAFLSTLRDAITHLPSGQVPAIVRLFPSWITKISHSMVGHNDRQKRDTSTIALLLADVCCWVLKTLPVQLTSAVAVANALQDIVQMMREESSEFSLGQFLHNVAGGTFLEQQEQQSSDGLVKNKETGLVPEFAAKLAIYGAVLEVHSQCSNMHPEVEPLPGQQVQISSLDSPNSTTKEQSDEKLPQQLGCFSPLEVNNNSGIRSLCLSDVYKVVSGVHSSCALQLSCLSLVRQRLKLLQERLLFLDHNTTSSSMILSNGSVDNVPTTTSSSVSIAVRKATYDELSDTSQLLLKNAVKAALESTTDGRTNTATTRRVHGLATVSSVAIETLHTAAQCIEIIQPYAEVELLRTYIELCLVPMSVGGNEGVLKGVVCDASSLLEWKQTREELPGVVYKLIYTYTKEVHDNAVVFKEFTKKKQKQQENTESAIALVQVLKAISTGKTFKTDTLSSAFSDAAGIARDTSIATIQVENLVNKSEKKKAASGKKRQSAEMPSSSGLDSIRDIVRLFTALDQIELEYLPGDVKIQLAVAVMASAACCGADLHQKKDLTLSEAENGVQLIISAVSLLKRVTSYPTSLYNQPKTLISCGVVSFMSAAFYMAHNLANALAASGNSSFSDGSYNHYLDQLAEDFVSILSASTKELLLSIGEENTPSKEAFKVPKLGTGRDKDSSMYRLLQFVSSNGALQACYDALSDNLIPGTPNQQPDNTISGSQIDANYLLELVQSNIMSPQSSSLALSIATNQEVSALDTLDLTLYSYIASHTCKVTRILCSSNPVVDQILAQHHHKEAAEISAQLRVLQSSFEDLPYAVSCILATYKDHPQIAARFVSSIEACCVLAGHMKPAATSVHFGYLLVVVLQLLARVGEVPEEMPSVRATVPFTARFPAASSSHIGKNNSVVRRALLEALRCLFNSANSQHTDHALTFLEACLREPIHGLLRLPIAEAVLMALEACTSAGGGASRAAKHHVDRLTAALTHSLSIPTTTGTDTTQQLKSSSDDGTVTKTTALGGCLSFKATLQRFLDVNELQGTPADLACLPDDTPCYLNEKSVVEKRYKAALGAEKATILRALESITARPRQFPFTATQTNRVLACIATLWQDVNLVTAGNEGAINSQLVAVQRGSLGILYMNSCAVLQALLRHRDDSLKRGFALVAGPIRALLSVLVVLEASEKISPTSTTSTTNTKKNEGGNTMWTVQGAKSLAGVMEQFANIKGSSKYCPVVLADYLVLAASPPNATWQSIIGPQAYRSLGSMHSTSFVPGSNEQNSYYYRYSGGTNNPLAAGALSLETSAALQYGACALYGSCTASEVQYLYACLGQRGSGAWRGALAALKDEYEKVYKYSGKV